MFGDFTSITEVVNFTFYFILTISVALLAFITFLMVFFVVRYHHTRHKQAAQVGHHTVLEIVWTVIPTLLVIAMFYYGFIGYRLMKTPPKDAMPVTAEARMWSWNFKYENGKTSPELYVPVGRAIKVNLWSGDVIHAFYAPHFMVKQDIVPGLNNFVWFKPEEEGTYNIFCAEYCGQRHSYMLSKIHVIPQDEFDEWVQKDVVVEEIDEGASEEERQAQLTKLGERLATSKGCNACHSIDGSKLVGPSYLGLYGSTTTVVTNGETRQVEVDDAYIRQSMLEPMADVVEGYQPVMPSQKGLLDDNQINALIAYIKSLK